MSSLKGLRNPVLTGWAGTLPFIGLVVFVLLAWPWSEQIFIAYSAAILAFLGGVRWGRALAGGDDVAGYAWGVLPSLWAWLCMMVPAAPAVGLLALGFAVQWWLDRRCRGPAPGWFMPLRTRLTIVVIACHLLVLAALLLMR